MLSSFKCQRCGACCRVEGQVRLAEMDITRLAAFMKRSEAGFIQEFTELARNRQGLVLKDQPDGACIFLDESGCRVNPVKPAQCMGFPHAWNNPGWERLCLAVSAPVDKPGRV